MIIKKWTGSAWQAQSAKTNAVDLVVDVTAGTPVSIFEVVGSTPKIKINYLPDAVFDSLYFQGALISNTTAASLAQQAKASATTLKRTPTGMYFVSSNATVTITGSTEPGVGSATLISGAYYSAAIYASDEGLVAEAADAYVPTTTLETGDWIVLQTFQGAGTISDPYLATFVVVENTYEIMTGASAGAGGTAGLVPSSLAGDQLKFLRANGTWAVPTDTNTTYGISTVNGDANSTKIRLTDSAAATDDVTIAVGAVGSTHGLTIAQASDVITIKHADTSAQATVTNTGRTYIQSITLDEYGHITSLASGTETVTDTNTTYSISAEDGTTGKKIIRLTAGGSGSGTDDVTLVQGTNTTLTRSNDEITIEATAYTAGNGISLASYQFSVAAGVGLTQEASGLKMTQPFISSASTPSASYQVTDNLWFDIA
jgi:hypothetical protein